ncbi:MAG: RCC1 domain-containing protein [Longimicrobiales bacterium]
MAAQIIVGNQNRYVRLTSSNVMAVGDFLQADVTVQNLLQQPLATQDGTNLDPDGVRVFFQDGPTNGVEVANADRTGTFTSTGQPFFQYDQILEPSQTSSVRGWEFTLNGASTFNFDVFVTAEVPDDNAFAFSLGDVSSGGNHSCGLDNAGNAYCWGDNSFGQLGDGTNQQRRIPTPVAGGLTFSTITTGAQHTCAAVEGGTAYCWGNNSSGQLGDGSTTDRSTATEVSGGQAFDIITAGGDHTCGLDGADAFCWGGNSNGQIGNGTTINSPTPTPVTGSTMFRAISAGVFHTCAVDAESNAFCWGQNSDGQIGNGTTTDEPAPVSIQFGDASFDQIAAGELHTCAVTNVGAVCWGGNASGQLGDGTNQQRLIPTPVVRGLDFVAVTTGNRHTCGLLGPDDGLPTAFCWGENFVGQLGDGSNQNRNVPTAVAGEIPFSAVDGGLAQTCGFSGMMGGIGHCWGDNLSGQLGDGTLQSVEVPVFIASTRRQPGG